MKSGDVLIAKAVICLGCGHSHLAKRSDAYCLDCKKIKATIKAKKRRLANPEKEKANLQAWRALNKDKTRKHKRDFQERNRAHRCAYQNAHRAEKLQRTPVWADMDAVKGIYELCGIFRRIGLDLHVDHIVPLKGEKVSGLHVENNLQLLHRLENISKKNRFQEIS